jgi:hypothetical protein
VGVKKNRLLARTLLSMATVFALAVGAISILVLPKLETIHFESARGTSPSHVLLVALDARPGGDSGLPDTLLLIDLDSGSYTQIPRDWTYSLDADSESLVQKHLGMKNCAPFCGIQGVYAYSKLGTTKPKSEEIALDSIRSVIEAEYQIPSLAVVAFDLTWAYSFLARIAPVTLEITESIPVGGTQTSEGYGDVKRLIEPGLGTFYGGDLYWIARARFGSSNEDRMQRQISLFEAIIEQKTRADIFSAAWGAKGLVLTDLNGLEVVRALLAYQPQ